MASTAVARDNWDVASDVLLRNGFAWNAASRSFEARTDVLCIDGRIAALGRELEVPASTTVVDCAGRYILPGLIDCHVHLTSGGDPAELTNRDATAARAWRAASNARKTLLAGFTTVRDLGAPEQLNIHLAKAVEAGLVEGPWILAAGLGVTMTGGHGHGFLAREADGPDEVRKAVREQLRAGASTIKLFASGGVMTPGVNPRSPSFTEDELAAGVEEAHKAFRIVAAHAQATEAIKNAVRAGVDSIEHGVWLDEEAIELMIENETTLVATLTAPAVMAERGQAEGVAAYAIEKSNLVLADHIASFTAAVRAGVRIAMGTDQGTPLNRPGENAQEIVRMARHGLSPAAAILAATAWAADLLGIEAGRLGAGLRADVVVFDGDPLIDLSVLTRTDAIRAIVQGGRIVHRPGEGAAR